MTSISSQHVLSSKGSKPQSLVQSPIKNDSLNSPYKFTDQSLENDDKYQLEKMNQIRLGSLKESLKASFDTIDREGLIESLKGDGNSSESTYRRVKEILIKCINDDKESLIDQMCQQYIDLKNEYSELKQDSLKAAKQYELRVKELADKLEGAAETNQLERKSKEYFEEKAENLQKMNEETKYSYEERLREKDDEINKLKEKVQELRVFEEEVRILGDELKDNENKSKNIQQECVTLQKEVALLKTKNKGHEKNIESLNLLIEEMQKVIDETQAVLRDSERVEYEQKTEIEILTEKNKQLEASLSEYLSQEKLIKGEFESKIQQIEKIFFKERDDQEKVKKELADKYKAKLKSKRKEIKEHKKRIAQQDQKIQEAEIRLQENDVSNDKMIELVNQQVEVQQKRFESRISEIEDEYQNQMEMMQSKHEAEIKDIERRFEDLLEKSVNQIMQESNKKILEMNEEIRRLLFLVQSKEEEMLNNYIRIEHHEKLMADKTGFLEQLKQDALQTKDYFSNKTDLKYKDQADEMVREFDRQVALLKNCVFELESQLNEVQVQKKDAERELVGMRQVNQNLKNTTKELAFEKEKAIETLEQWRVKAEKFKKLYQEEESITVELKKHLSKEIKKYEETAVQLQASCEEILKRDKSIGLLKQEIEKIEMKSIQLESDCKQLESRSIHSKKELSNKESLQEGEINTLKEENSMLKEESEKLRAKIADMSQKFTIESEKMINLENELNSKVRKAEEKILSLEYDLKAQQKQVTDLTQGLVEVQNQNRELSTKNTQLQSDLGQLKTEKQSFQDQAEELATKLLIMKKQTEDLIFSKIVSIKNELKNLKQLYLDSFNLYIKENNLKVEELVNTIETIQNERNEKHQQDIQALQLKCKLEADSLLEKSIVKHKQAQGDLIESYEYKIVENELKFKKLEQTNEQIKEQNVNLQKQLQKLNLDYNLLQKNYKDLEEELANSNKNIKDKEQELNDLSLKLLSEVSEKDKQLKEMQINILNQESLMEQKYIAEINALRDQIEILEQQINEISLSHANEIERTENCYKLVVNNLQLALETSKFGEAELKKESCFLKEKLELLETKLKDTQGSILSVKMSRNKHFNSYTDHLETQSLPKRTGTLTTESTKIESIPDTFRTKSPSKDVRKDALNRSQAAILAAENEFLQKKLVNLEEQVRLSTQQISRQQELESKMWPQSTENKRKQKLFSSFSLSGSTKSPYSGRAGWSLFDETPLNSGIPDLDKKYDDHFRFSSPRLHSKYNH